jgi:hypothetical protein
MYNGKGMKKYLQDCWFETLRGRGYLGDKCMDIKIMSHIHGYRWGLDWRLDLLTTYRS